MSSFIHNLVIRTKKIHEQPNLQDGSIWNRSHVTYLLRLKPKLMDYVAGFLRKIHLQQKHIDANHDGKDNDWL